MTRPAPQPLEPADLAAQLRADAARRADAASRLPFGQDRACEFAYALGLLDAAARLG